MIGQELEKYLDNINKLKGQFTFTADHEEPCCSYCDWCSSCNDGKHCGPEYGWSRYRRTVSMKDMTPIDEKTIELILDYIREKEKNSTILVK